MGQSIADIIENEIRSNRTSLPLFSGTVRRLNEMAASGEFDSSEVADLIGADPSLSAAVLRAANSSFYSSLERVASIQQAITRIGVKSVSNLALVAEQKSQYGLSCERLQPVVDALWKHAVVSAAGSEWLAKKIGRADISADAFMGGMLHDIGQLLVLRVIDDLIQKHAKFDPSDDLILEIMARMHTECGARLMTSWNMPDAYVAVVGSHHRPLGDEEDALLAAIRLADLACNKLGIGIHPANDSNLAATAEAGVLRLSEVGAAELELALEDALDLAASI